MSQSKFAAEDNEETFLFADVPLRSAGRENISVLPQVEYRGDAPVLLHRNIQRYQHLKLLGEGGMGEVVLGRDHDICRDVAFKRLKDPPPQQEEALARFIEEIQTVGQLEHPGIVPIYDVGVDEQGRYFFVMKYVQGETMEEIIAKLAAGDPKYQQRFSYEYRTAIFMQVLCAIQYAHDKGFLHRDIKPGNVIVGPYGEVMVMDWGLAKKYGQAGPPDACSPPGQSDEGKTLADPIGPRGPKDSPNLKDLKDPKDPFGSTVPDRDEAPRPHVSALFGTPAYMSPEQVMGKNGSLDPRSDTYSLCVLFYEMITLSHYLDHRPTLQAKLMSILAEEPPSALQLHHRHGAPPELTNFIRRGLAKDPAERYQSADEMIRKLQAVVEGHIPVVCPCTGIKRAGSRYSDFLNAQPNVAVALLVIAGLFLLSLLTHH